MGCRQSSNAIRPVDVYDDRPVGAVRGEVAAGQASSAPPPQLPSKRVEARAVTADSAYSEGSVDSGMGLSVDSSSMFRNVPAIPRSGFSIDTQLARTNTQVVSICARRLNIEEYPDGRLDGKSCSIYWHSQVHNDMKQYIKGAECRVNKFPGMTELARKIALTHAIRSMKKLFPTEYDFYPKSWVLPSQQREFRSYCGQNPAKWFIVKPDEGTGIYLVNRVEQIHSTTDRILVQEYLADPYLLPDKLKFDFRVYAVIRSLNPLSIYVAREGMARFCTEKYQKPTSGNITHLFSHLTNYSLNKTNGRYIHSKNLKEQLKGSKRLLSTVFHQMESNGVRTRKLWHDVKMIIVKTVLAMVPEIMLNYERYFSDVQGPQCFQIMGFDIIVDRNGTPFLLEVNSAPSLSIEHTITDNEMPVKSIVDEMIKVPLVRDTILLVLDQLNPKDLVPSNSDQTNNNLTEDDMSVQNKRRKPHLSEIFPARYGNSSRHLLILDRAVYLFMQVGNVKQSLVISFLAMRSFLRWVVQSVMNNMSRKCNLTDAVSADDLEKMFCAVNYNFTGREHDLNTGLPFHGFLQLLFQISWAKFPFCEDQLAALQRFFSYCDSALRHYGVRSTRLRRAEVEPDVNANSVEIYLLPGRMRKPRSGPAAPGQSARKSRWRSGQRGAVNPAANVVGGTLR